MRTDIETVVPYTPCLQGCSGNLELFGRLTLGEPLSSQRSVLGQEVRTFEPIPVGLASIVALGLRLYDRSHGALLDESFAF
jgi:hypothetical protein